MNARISVVFAILLCSVLLVAGCKQQSGKTAAARPAGPKVIICFGDSLTTGLGLKPEETYPALIQQRIKEIKADFKVVNAGASGATSADGVSRIDGVLAWGPFDIIIIELGANDGLRGLDINQMKANLQTIIAKVRAGQPNAKIYLAGMDTPPTQGQTYRQDFFNAFPDVAKKANVTLIPYILNGVGGVPAYNQEDGAHPNAVGTKKMMENIWEVLKTAL